LCQGCPAALFEARTGLAPEQIAAALAKLRQRGLLLDDAARLQPSETGLRYLNELLLDFM
jgi:oxygen-independent coproporphyrinogen-3 oxidase